MADSFQVFVLDHLIPKQIQFLDTPQLNRIGETLCPAGEYIEVRLQV